MRHRSLLMALGLLGSIALCADAQGSGQSAYRARRSPRGFITISDGLGVGSSASMFGGVGLMQNMRVSATARLSGVHGVEVAATRIQMVMPTNQGLTDPQFANPAGDGVFVSYANLAPQRGGGFPSVFTLGAGVFRRDRVEGTGNLDTWAARVGFEDASMFRPARWMDLNVSGHLMVIPGSQGQRMYTAGLSLGIRIG